MKNKIIEYNQSFTLTKIKLTTVASLVSAFLGTCHVPALAQEQQPESDKLQLERIEVTSRRQVENLQSVPVAVSAFSEQDLENRGIENSADVANFTPNVQFDTSSSFAGASTFQAFIRGVGQSDFAINTDPGVAVYIDGVYLARTVGSVVDLLDVERIEVLKGPQGTLFGRNSIGGAINITTKTPGTDFSFSGKATVGSFNRTDISAVINMPLSDYLSSSVAFTSNSRDGYQQRIPFPDDSGQTQGVPLDQILTADTNNGKAPGAINNQTARVKLLYDPLSDYTVTFSADYSSIRDAATPATLLDAEVGLEKAGGLVGLFNACVAGVEAVAPICNTSPYMAQQTLAYNNQFLTGDIDKTYATGANFTNIDSYGGSLAVYWDFSEELSVKYITSLRQIDAAFGVDIDSSPLAYDQTTFTIDQEQMSHELQLSGSYDALSFTVGAFYFDESATQSDFVPIAGGLVQVSGDNSQETTSYAIYGEADYNLTDDVSVVFGARYTEEEKELNLNQKSLNPDFFLATGIPAVAFPREDLAFLGPEGPITEDFSNFSVRTGINWQINKSWFTYASFSQGYKSGGFTTRLTAPFNPEIGIGGLTDLDFEEETVDSFEIGLKGEFFDNRIRFNAAAFANSYENIQIVVQRGITPANENAGEAEINGLELEFEAIASEDLTINASLGYTDAKYTELDALLAQSEFGAFDKSAELPNTPELTASAALNWYLTDIVEEGELVYNFNYSYTSDVYNDTENTELLHQDATSIIGTSLKYTAELENWDVKFGVSNLTDERRLISGFNAGSLNFVIGSYNRPREWYLTFGYHHF
ncbi:MAG: hypothetical protein CMI12_10130 [Oceanospirillum sp.]|nr:hypothetical protein [Oceanospirillum sp.]